MKIELRADDLDGYGMVTDFANLAPFGSYISATLDHQDLNALQDASGGPLLPHPTSEMLAAHLFTVARRVLPASIAALIHAVTVAETPSSSATFAPPVLPPVRKR